MFRFTLTSNWQPGPTPAGMNTRNGSTSPVLEDPPATELEEKPKPQGGENQPEDTQDDDAQQTEVEDPDDKETPPPSAEPKSTDKPTKKAAPAQDPVKAAIERLRTDGDKPTAPNAQAKTQPAKPGDVKPTNGATAEPTTSENGDDATQSRVDPALKDWTPQELKHTKGAVKDRFRQLHTRVQELEEIAPYAESGREFTALIQAEKLHAEVETLDDKQIAWSLRAQGAAVRAVQAIKRGLMPAAKDLDVIDQLRAGVAEVDKAIGRRAAPSDPVALAEAFTGDIPEDLKEQAELAGLNEKETRLIAALRAHKAAPPKPAAPVVPQNQPTEREGREPEPQQGHGTHSVASERMYARRSNQALAEKCNLKPEQVQGYFAKHISPILGQKLAADFPGQPAGQVFKDLGPAERHQLVIEAIAEHQKRQPLPANPPPGSQTPGHKPLKAGGSGAGPSAPGDPVAAAIQFLRSD